MTSWSTWVYKNKTRNSTTVWLYSGANVDCPHQVEVGDWYNQKEGKKGDLSFSCGSIYTECCKYLQHDKGVLRTHSRTFNNRPFYIDVENRKYCIFYFRKQWIVANCKSSVDDWKN